MQHHKVIIPRLPYLNPPPKSSPQGAPETIQERLAHVPAGYEAAYKRFTRQGSRVLTLAYKHLPDMPVGDLRSLERDTAESDLTFAGFAVFACPLRDDSADALLSLKNSSHELVMITGDQALTACHVAAQVHIVDRPVLILTERKSGGWEWLSPDEVTAVEYEEAGVEEIAQEYDLCVAGKGIEMLQQTGEASGECRRLEGDSCIACWKEQFCIEKSVTNLHLDCFRRPPFYLFAS